VHREREEAKRSNKDKEYASGANYRHSKHRRGGF